LTKRAFPEFSLEEQCPIDRIGKIWISKGLKSPVVKSVRADTTEVLQTDCKSLLLAVLKQGDEWLNSQTPWKNLLSQACAP
jgi:hypothetical protein